MRYFISFYCSLYFILFNLVTFSKLSLAHIFLYYINKRYFEIMSIIIIWDPHDDMKSPQWLSPHLSWIYRYWQMNDFNNPQLIGGQFEILGRIYWPIYCLFVYSTLVIQCLPRFIPRWLIYDNTIIREEGK